MNKDINRQVLINVSNYYVQDKDFVEVDVLLANGIKILNKKGYKTCFCCSGHVTTPLRYVENYPEAERVEHLKKRNEEIKIHGTDGYITFADTYDTLPYLHGWYMDMSHQVKDCGTTIRCTIMHPTYRKMKKFYSRFNKWCRKLPKID